MSEWCAEQTWEPEGSEWNAVDYALVNPQFALLLAEANDRWHRRMPFRPFRPVRWVSDR